MRTILRIAGPLDLSSDEGPKFSSLEGDEWEAQWELVQEFIFELQEFIEESGQDDKVKIILTSEILRDDAAGGLIA